MKQAVAHRLKRGSHAVANSVAPRWIGTEMHFGTGPDAPKQKTELEDYEFEYASMKRLGHPEEIAAAIVFLLSEDASYITTSTLHVDGGLVGNRGTDPARWRGCPF